jgi:PAS domain S-box-containing protein
MKGGSTPSSKGEKVKKVRREVAKARGAVRATKKPAAKIACDIVERKQVEEKLKESEERYRDLFENANDLIQMVAPDGRFLYINRAWRETLGYNEGEVRNLSVFDIIHPDSQAHCLEIFQRVISGEKVDRVETAFATKDGKKVIVEGSVNCKFVNGKPVSTRGIFRDITERKRMEEELKKYRDHLEGLVEERTAELKKINEQLQREIAERKMAEGALHKVNQVLKTIRECNQALVRATKEADLLHEICRIIVEVGGYRLAWVGFAEQDEEKTVRPPSRLMSALRKSLRSLLAVSGSLAKKARIPSTGLSCSLLYFALP